MSSSAYQVRRATLDDIGQLTTLWQTMRFNADELAKRATDFQVAIGPDGKLAGAIALQIEQKQGRIHSEAFYDFSLADQVRPLFWDRLNSIASNHGLLRLWTQEDAPFWTHCGLVKADEETLSKLPAPWRVGQHRWLTLKLREDIQEVISADKEFALFMESERQRTQRAMQHAKVLKFVATLIALAVLGLVVVGAILVLRHNRVFLHH